MYANIINTHKMAAVLIGDIGGTNIRYQYMIVSESSTECIKSVSYLSSIYKQDLVASILFFLEDLLTPSMAVLGICGLISNNTIIASNTYGSGLNSTYISLETGIPKVFILNDVECSGHSIIYLRPSEYFCINSCTPEPSSPIACISVGTGIGLCLLIKSNDHNFKVYPSEAGSQDFSPKNKQDLKLFEYISKRINQNSVSYNKLLNSNSMHMIYEYYREKLKKLVNKEFDKEYEKVIDKGKFIMENGFSGIDKIAEMSVTIWLRILGNFIGNSYFNYLPFGGIYIFGGVISKNFENIIKRNEILEGYYLRRPKFEIEAMKTMPIYIVKSDDLGLRGALEYVKLKLP